MASKLAVLRDSRADRLQARADFLKQHNGLGNIIKAGGQLYGELSDIDAKLDRLGIDIDQETAERERIATAPAVGEEVDGYFTRPYGIRFRAEARVGVAITRPSGFVVITFGS